MNSVKLSAVAVAAAGLFGAAASAQAAQYANVISSTPVQGSVAVPRQDCVQGERLVQQQPSGAGALIGAIAGGVIGNQFGHGFGRAAATGLGVVAGSAVGNSVEANGNGAVAVPVQRCRTVSAYESRTIGYDVVYEYNGQRYTTRLPRDPGARVAIAVQAQAAPVESYSPPAVYDAPPTYSEPSSGYYEQAPAYYAPAPVVYGPSYGYVAPAVVGLGVGYWVGRTWHRGYYRGGYGHHWR